MGKEVEDKNETGKWKCRWKRGCSSNIWELGCAQGAFVMKYLRSKHGFTPHGKDKKCRHEEEMWKKCWYLRKSRPECSAVI